MMLNDDNRKSVKKMLKGRALYIALGICVLAAGAVGYMAMDINPSPQTDGGGTTAEKLTFSNIKTPDLSDYTTGFSGIEIEQPPQSEPETQAVFDNNQEPLSESTTESREISFSSPLSLVMGMDYSMGIPVFSQTMSDYRTHNGVDFRGVKGENVKAVAEGDVISVKKNAVWGNSVSVDHGGGIVSTISGLADEALIAEGAHVNAGTVIGILGTVPVEAEEPDHVHLEIRVNGELADPLEIMGLNGTEE